MINALVYALHGLPALLADVGIMGPGAGGQQALPVGDVAATVVNQVANGAQPAAPVGGMGGWTMLLLWGGVILVMYLLMFRPQRKREKKLKELQSSISAGDNVVTNSGLFGRIADVGEDCFIVEFGTNRGIRIPILKSEIVGIRAPKMTATSGDVPAVKEKEKEKEKEKGE
ncbi:MAG: preprotein translocase subunit YajC [Defluviitaleaceae bacterium]|nr:preprotein translocase subunit YajC [Defluviitaleaceae bacterium]MCL2239869.1 preprotein translocase subunit YajC [Defluviitaleaceae bacterium]